MAIMAALNARPRGCLIDISMLEATLATMGWAISNYLIGGIAPKANGNETPTSAPSGTFQASDAMINIAANKDAQWQTLARHLGRDNLLELLEYNNRKARKCDRFRLKAELGAVLTRGRDFDRARYSGKSANHRSLIAGTFRKCRRHRPCH